jgi:hypothetical protein
VFSGDALLYHTTGLPGGPKASQKPGIKPSAPESPDIGLTLNDLICPRTAAQASGV